MYGLFRPLLFKLGAETAHHVGSGSARLAQSLTPGLLASMYAYEDERLAQSLWGLDFPNPVGLAAGFDKNARLMVFCEQLGFGFTEVGSVSAQASRGNRRPRAFRLPEDQALVNRMGLNNQGAKKVARRIARTRNRITRPLGVNLAKTHSPDIMGAAAVADFVESFEQLAPLADYVVLNISCPNTSEGKTFEDADALDELLQAIFAVRKAKQLTMPLLLKLSPPLTEQVVFDSMVEQAVALAMRYGIAGFIATNTASEWGPLNTPEKQLSRVGQGGLSGAPLEKRATQLVRYLYRKTGGTIPVIGVGGVASAESAYAKIRAGASLVQLYTALVYEGPLLIRTIKEGLVGLLERDGFDTIVDAIGVDA